MERVEVTDEWLYKYMPVVNSAIIRELEKQADYSHRFSQRFERKMKRLIRKEALGILAIIGEIAKYVAVVIICILGIALAVTMSVEAYRAKFFDSIKTYLKDNSVECQYVSYEGMEGECVLKAPSYVPKGYEEVQRTESELVLRVTYENGSGKVFYWENLKVIDTMGVGMDTEYDRLGQYEIHGVPVSIAFYNDGYKYAYMEYGISIFMVSGTDLTKEEILKMLESVIVE
ncbi:MAG: DUF4367 domain-containing protein [Lachnospiraceae bacterium]|nr:DUF4367 domain-containing protein [Lachnospiraceae bacterium]